MPASGTTNGRPEPTARQRYESAKARYDAATMEAAALSAEKRAALVHRNAVAYGSDPDGVRSGGGGFGGYRAARYDRLFGRPFAAMRDAASTDAWQDEGTLATLRALSRALDRDEPMARAFTGLKADLTVGSGPKLEAMALLAREAGVGNPRFDGEREDAERRGDAQTGGIRPQTANRRFNEAAERLWRDWFGSAACDVRGLATGAELLGQMVRDTHLDGDLLWIGTREHGGTIQLVEAARVINPGSRQDDAKPEAEGPERDPLRDRAATVGGVEVDRVGRVVAYHVAPWGPNEHTIDAGRTERVAAAPPGLDQFGGARLLVPPRHRSANQTRGEPAYAACVGRFESLNRLSEAVRVAYEMAAASGLVARTVSPVEYMANRASSGDEPTTVRDGQTFPYIDMAPGMFEVIGNTEELVQIKPEHPSAQYEPLVLLELMAIGADQGLAALLAMLDFRQVNFHASRTAVVLTYRTIRRLQAWLLAHVLRPLYRWKLRRWIKAGMLPYVDGWSECQFSFPPAPVLDPEKEMKAAALGLDKGILTHQAAIAATGRDETFEENAATRAAEKRTHEALDIAPAPTPGTVDPSANGGDAEDGGGDADDDDDA